MAEKGKYQPPVPIRNLDPDIYHRAKAAAKLLKQNVGAWITESIRQRLNRENINREKGL